MDGTSTFGGGGGGFFAQHSITRPEFFSKPTTTPFVSPIDTSSLPVAVVAPSPIPLHFRAVEAPPNANLPRDNYGALRGYPQPFSRGVSLFGRLVNYLELDWDGRTSADISLNTPPTCSLTPSSAKSNFTSGLTDMNCTQACADPALLFEPTTFSSCLQLGTAAMYVEAGIAAVVRDDAATRQTGETLAFNTDLSGINGTKIVRNMIACAVGGCRAKGSGVCGDEILNLRNMSVEVGSLAAIHAALDHYCAHADSIVNEDVAGPGVLMSYVFQTGIALLFWLLAKMFTSLLRPFFWFAYKIRSATHDTAWKKAGSKQHRLALTRGNAAVICSMVEFQEVQGFFVAAIQLATLVTFRGNKGPDLTVMDSFGSLIFNSSLVQVLAVSGVLPVLLVQCCLQRAGMRWWYTLAISTAVFILGLIVDTRGGFILPQFQTVYDTYRTNSPIAECGGNPSPLLYCPGNLPFVVSDDMGQFISYWVLPALLVDQIGHDLWRRYALERKVRRWERSRRVARMLRRDVFPVVWNMGWIVLQFVLLSFTLMYFHNIFLLVFESSLLSDTKWTYGQLVAIMVWAPILGKYLYFNVFGIEEGFSRRLAKHYKVVHHDESSDEEGGGNDDDSLSGHRAMEQGIELKDTPNTSTTSLPGPVSPTTTGVVDLSRPATATAGQLQEPPADGSLGSSTVTRRRPQSREQQQQPTPTPHYPSEEPPPFEQEPHMEGVTMAGGVMIAVENHEPHGR